MKKYKVADIFYSLQGEGGWAGTPMVFVRFAGCNLNCHFCDTNHNDGIEMTAVEIATRVISILADKIGIKPIDMTVCFTGGEPLLQLDSELLLAVKAIRGPVTTYIHLETNGTLAPPTQSGFRCITISPKKKAGSNLGGVLSFGRNVELKIIWDTTDKAKLDSIWYSWTEPKYKYHRKYIQPMTNSDGTTNVEEVMEFILIHPEWNLSLQIQNILKIK